MLETIKQFYQRNPKEFLYRLLSILLSSLILPNIVILLFVVYMSHGNFFSYDFFIDGLFGMKLFFMVTIIMTFFMSLMFAGTIIVFLGKKKYQYSAWKSWWLVILLNILMIFAFASASYSKIIPWEWFIFLFIISIAICTHISIMLFYNAKNQLISFIIFMFVISYFTISFSEQTSRLLSLGLRSFGIGGYINTEITVKDDKIKKGKLILITPKSIYLRPIDSEGVEIFQLNYIESIYIGNDVNLSKSITKHRRQ